MIATVLIAIAALIALALWWRHQGKRQHSRATPVRGLKRPSDNFHCVELRYASKACDAVKQIGAKRFLPGEAPEIPVRDVTRLRVLAAMCIMGAESRKRPTPISAFETERAPWQARFGSSKPPSAWPLLLRAPATR